MKTDAGEEFWTPWFEQASFTQDWSTRAFATWATLLADVREQPLDVLEVGSWEGRGTIFFLNYLKNSSLTCIDLFMLGNEGLFNSNVMDKYWDRVRKIKSRSGTTLDALATVEKRSFDLIYVDGSHDRDDVMVDTILAWRLLRVGGIMIWDDYLIKESYPSFLGDQDPKPAIDVFLDWHNDEHVIIYSGYQLAIRKVKPHYQIAPTLMNPEVP